MRKDRLVSETLGEDLVLTPSDLYSHEFKRATMGGYKPDEVDEYLERVADVMESLIEQVRSLKKENDEQRERLAEFREMENTLRNALVSSQQFSENMLESARREAQAILEEARLKKAETQLEATRMPEELTKDIRALKGQRERLRVEILSVLETHKRLLDTLLPVGQSELTPPAYFNPGGGAKGSGGNSAALGAELPAELEPLDPIAPAPAEPVAPAGSDAWRHVFDSQRRPTTVTSDNAGDNALESEQPATEDDNR